LCCSGRRSKSLRKKEESVQQVVCFIADRPMLVSKLKEKWLTKDGKTVDLEKQARILRFLQRITPIIT
jgi:hypothetical protein